MSFDVQGQVKSFGHIRECCKLLIDDWAIGIGILISSVSPEKQQYSSVAFCSRFLQINCFSYWWKLFSLWTGWNYSDVSSCFFLPFSLHPNLWVHALIVFFLFPLQFLSVFQTRNLVLIFMCHVCLIKHTHWIIWLLCNIRALMKWISHWRTCKVMLK